MTINPLTIPLLSGARSNQIEPFGLRPQCETTAQTKVRAEMAAASLYGACLAELPSRRFETLTVDRKFMSPFHEAVPSQPRSASDVSGAKGAADAARGERIEDLVRAHSPYVAGLAYRLLGRDSDVDDVVQDVFVALLRFRSAIREVDALRGWLATTTVRLARKRLRRRALREFLGLDDLDAEPTVRGATQEEHLALLRIHRALSRVPANARVVWLLRYVEQERMEEVARLAGCSLTTAKRRLETAQVAVKKALGHDF